jgi:restriction system protein
MAIPDYQTIMLPLLKLAADRQEHSLREAIDTLAEDFGLTDNERRELLPSGRQPTFDNRVGWALTYMKKAGLVKATRRAHFQITERGLRTLAEQHETIDTAHLRQFPEFVEFQRPKSKEEEVSRSRRPLEDGTTPEEAIEAAYQKLRGDLANDLLDTIKACSPAFFERLVIDLLVKMGYGGTRQDAGQALGRSGDGGIDGIIKEDRLGLDVVYVQAKRWEGNVSRPEVQKFAGALQGRRAKRGVFITTSDFSQGAREYVSLIDSKIVLIDGVTLAQLMVDFDIGVTSFAAYELKRIDSDYFSEE